MTYKRRNNIQFRGSMDDWCGTYVSCSERLLCFVYFPNLFVLCTKLSLLSLLLFGYYCSHQQSTYQETFKVSPLLYFDTLRALGNTDDG